MKGIIFIDQLSYFAFKTEKEIGEVDPIIIFSFVKATIFIFPRDWPKFKSYEGVPWIKKISNLTRHNFECKFF